jgi:release factor glutamine methyltransferase
LSHQEPEVRTWTIRDVLVWASEDFKKRGLTSARLESELLLAEVLGTDRIRLVIDATRPLTKDELSRFRDLIGRRRKGEPIAYILGRREFYGRTFKTDSRALVPRPDTETLVDVALERTRPRNLFARALDLCTGTGVVALTLLRERPTWRVTGTDISAEALSLAVENAQRLGAISGLRLAEGDLFEAVLAGEKFELITSNPPYIPTSELAELDADIRDFEPKLALDGGSDGLDFYRRLIREAPRFLVPGGVLAVEIGCTQGTAVTRMLEEVGFRDIETRRDLAQLDRVVSAKAPAPTPPQPAP